MTALTSGVCGAFHGIPHSPLPGQAEPAEIDALMADSTVAPVSRGEDVEIRSGSLDGGRTDCTADQYLHDASHGPSPDAAFTVGGLPRRDVWLSLGLT